jgi:phage shock protein PspC (stress-responsive transcriptional regulator)
VDDHLYRSITDRPLTGVCGGLAAWLGLDPSIVRIAWILLSVVSGGVFVIIYIVMAIVVPNAPPGWAPRGRLQGNHPGAWSQEQPPSQGGVPGQGAPGGAWTNTPGWQGGPRPASSGPNAAPPPGPVPPGASSPGGPSSRPEEWSRSKRNPGSGYAGDRAGIIVGAALVVLGVWFLVRPYISIDWDVVWPVAVIALGAVLIVGAVRRGR